MNAIPLHLVASTGNLIEPCKEAKYETLRVEIEQLRAKTLMLVESESKIGCQDAEK